MRPRRPREEQILVWCGVVAQLSRTRVREILEETGLPYPLFVLLQHFCHDPEREWTVSGLARAFQAPAPGISKNVARAVERGWLRWRSDPHDQRVKHLHVTAAGIRVRDRAAARVLPDRKRSFRGWSREEVATLHRLLERLKTDMDAARDPEPAEGARGAAGG